MRKLLLLGLVVLVALVCLPAVVSAAESDTVVVSGTVSSAIDVSIIPDTVTTVTMGNTAIAGEPFTIGDNNNLDDIWVRVTTTMTSWKVVASDNDITISEGYMRMSSGLPHLTSEFQWQAGEDLSSWHNLWTDGTNPNVVTGMSSVTNYDTPVRFRQVILASEAAAAGSYSITVLFTGSAN
jgi:hypothetical protein